MVASVEQELVCLTANLAYCLQVKMGTEISNEEALIFFYS